MVTKAIETREAGRGWGEGKTRFLAKWSGTVVAVMRAPRVPAAVTEDSFRPVHVLSTWSFTVPGLLVCLGGGALFGVLWGTRGWLDRGDVAHVAGT